MEIEIKYHLEILGQLSFEGQTVIECSSLEEGERKLKSLRGNELYVYLIKTVKKNNKEEKFIIS